MAQEVFLFNTFVRQQQTHDSMPTVTETTWCIPNVDQCTPYMLPVFR